MRRRKIGSGDTAVHAAFFGFVDASFPGSGAAGWDVWQRRGGWTGDYEVFAVFRGERIIATIGRSRMRLVVACEACVGYQLGAVATLAPYRGMGLARTLMDWVIGELDAADQPLFLFANRSVLDFYPRFGFVRAAQMRSLAVGVVRPAGVPAPRCDPADPADRARLAALCAEAVASGDVFGVRDYGWLALWHLSCRPITAFWVADGDALVATTRVAERLIVHDVIARRRFDLREVVPRLIERPVDAVEFRFDASAFWPGAVALAFDDSDEALFVRGRLAAMTAPVRFPGLAHT